MLSWVARAGISFMSGQYHGYFGDLLGCSTDFLGSSHSIHCKPYISRTKVLTHRTLQRTQDSYQVTEYPKRQTTWPGRRSILYPVLRFYYVSCSGLIPRAAPLALGVLGVYGGEGLDWNEAGSGSNFCPTAVVYWGPGSPSYSPTYPVPRASKYQP